MVEVLLADAKTDAGGRAVWTGVSLAFSFEAP